MTKERLSPLDASFLQLEDATSHMQVAGTLIFAGKPPTYERLLARVESHLGLVPRYRQRIAEVPLAQARPRWVDDERFDLRYHVRRTALPRPGTEDELRVLAGRVFSHHLRRDRPLWEMWLTAAAGLRGDEPDQPAASANPPKAPSTRRGLRGRPRKPIALTPVTEGT